MKTKMIYIMMAITCAVLVMCASAFGTIVLEVHSDTTNGSTTFTDSSANPTAHNIDAKVGAQHSTAQAKYGTSSMSFVGNNGDDGDYLSIPDSPDWSFGSGDFTIDTWVRFNNLTGYKAFIGSRETGGSNYWYFHFGPTEGLRFQWNGGHTIEQGSVAGWGINTWYHIAVVRSGDNFNLYRNGISVAFGIDSGSITDVPDVLGIGAFEPPTWNQAFNGYLDDLYIRTGEALDATDLLYITDKGGRMFEASKTITAGVNTAWEMGFSQVEIEQLSQFYLDGQDGLEPVDVTIGGTKWRYYDTLPNQENQELGDVYEFEGMKYVFLGSGVGEVPELPLGAIQMMMLVFGLGVIYKKRFLNNSLL